MPFMESFSTVRYLKGQFHEIFASGFFRESSSPKALIPLIPYFVLIYISFRENTAISQNSP